MKGIREIKGRIKAVQNTSKITRAMQLVAASKMKRAQDTAEGGRAYAWLLAEILASLSSAVDLAEVAHPLIEARPVKKKGVLVISTDKGLCGALNSNLFRYLIQRYTIKETAFITIGRKATQFVSRAGGELMADFSISDHAQYSEVRPIVRFLLDAYTEKRIDSLDVVYPRFVNTLTQESNGIHMLPMSDLEEELRQLRVRTGVTEGVAPEDDREFILEPDAATLLASLPELFVKQEIYHLVLQAKASEHSARMVAMKSATDNAKSLIESLTLEYNKARQAGITQEILEIAAATANN